MTDTARSSGTAGQLEGLGAVVTGSSTGIGETIARTLAAAGAGVVVCGRDRTRADDVAASIRSVGGRAYSAVADLAADPATIREFAKAAASELDGQVDILVNNAAFYPVTATEALPDPDLDAMLAVNVRAPHVLVGELAPLMAQRGHGSVVNISSWMSRVGTPYGAMY